MPNTILEKLQEKYSNAEGINDARNIAEVLAGNRGANAIADVVDGFGKSTVLYTDGLLIINELAEDRAANIAEHDEVVKEYDPWCKRQPYVFAKDQNILWYDDRTSVLSVKFGSEVKPSSTNIWFSGLQNCTNIDLDGLDVSNTTSADGMFQMCSSLPSLDVSGLNVSNVTSMKAMFYGCSTLTELDLSGFDTSNVTAMTSMFGSCSSLSELNLSGFDTSEVTDMSGMFQYCTSLSELNLSGFDTSEVTAMPSMFAKCSALTTLDLSGFDTSNVTNFAQMFYDCTALTELDISGFNTSKVITMYSMFSGCSKLTELDLSSFDTSKVRSMQELFNGNTALESITVSDKFVTTALDPSRYPDYDKNMFYNCTSLVGGNGTTYSSSHVNSEYARIDTEETPGYFTAAS